MSPQTPLSIDEKQNRAAPPANEGTCPKVLAIVGHPNVGKSVVFHALTGKYVTVSNFPGTTVDLTRGQGRIAGQTWLVYDTPGVVSLQAKTEDERVTRDLLIELKPDVILQVGDAKNLSRELHLAMELAEFGRPMALALNMSDERRDRGLEIDVARLARRLGIPVIETVAIEGEGIPELKEALSHAGASHLFPRYDPAVQKTLENIESHFKPETGMARALAVSLLTKNKYAWAHAVTHTLPGLLGSLETVLQKTSRKFVRPPEILMWEAKREVAQEVLGEVLSKTSAHTETWLAHLGRWSMLPFPGYLLAGFTLFLLYEFVGVFGAGTLVDFLENRVFGEFFIPAIVRWTKIIIPFSLVQEAFIGPYGIITMALTYALALILPIVTTFFLFFGFLEDSGYLPRLAVMMNRFFRLMGLNGRAVLPMVLGLGCDTMATVTTRILDTRKEKIIVSLLLTLSVPCSAQLGAILGMAAGLSAKVLGIWFAVVAGTMLLVGWSAARLLPGSRSPFLVEIPPLRVPRLSNLVKKVKARLKWYLKEVIPLFIAATFVLFVLDKLHFLRAIEQAVSPIVVSFLGLPEKATEAFLIGFFRRDYGAAGFFQMTQAGLLNARQVTVAMTVITLFMPCIAHVLITIRERGWKATIGIMAFVLSFSLGVGGLLNWILIRTSFL